MEIHIPHISPSRIEVVVFDFGGVVLDVDFSRTLRALEAHKIEGLVVADILAENQGPFRDLELGQVTPEEFIEALRDRYPATQAIPAEALWEAWNALLLSFDPARVALVEALRRHYPVYLLSNTNLPHRRHWYSAYQAQFGRSFDALFDRCFYSDELHLRKPNPEIYRLLAGQIGVKPASILFIDDNAANIAQAQAEGWQAYQLTNGQSITDLFEL